MLIVTGILGIARIRQQDSLLASQNYFRVDEVWANADALVGRKITVEGKVSFEIAQAVILCCPPSCDCNETYGWLYLISDSSTRYNKEMKYRDDIAVQITCGGNECSLTCSPFDPQYAERLEITGMLDSEERDGKIRGLYMSEIDFSASRQYVDGEWMPISVGSFEIERATLTPHPNACQPSP